MPFLDSSLLRVIRAAALSAAGALLAATAAAAPPALKLSEYAHSTWPAGGAVPSQVQSIAQTGDGYLWMVKRGSLVRFDGVDFERFRTLGGQSIADAHLATVTGDGAGGLWLGYTDNKDAGHFSNGKFERLAGYDAWGGNGKHLTAIDLDGATWTVTGGKLSRITRQADHRFSVEKSFPFKEVTALVIDARGTVWVVDASVQHFNAFFLPRGETRFLPARWGAADMALGPDGSIWGTSAHSLSAQFLKDGRPDRAVEVNQDTYGSLAFDRDGGLWVWTERGTTHAARPQLLFEKGGDALLRAELPEGSEHEKNAPLVWTYFEDRDGNMWLATSNGLERYRRTPVRTTLVPSARSAFTLAASDDGNIIAGNWNSGLVAIAQGESRILKTSIEEIDSLTRDSGGGVWLGGWDVNGTSIWQVDPAGGLTQFAIPAAHNDNKTIRAIAGDSAGNLWVGLGGSGPAVRLHIDAGTHKIDNAVAQPWRASVIVVGAGEKRWSALEDVVLLHDGDQSTTLPSAGVGTVRTLLPKGSRLWVGGADGVALFDGTAFHHLQRADGEPFHSIGGIVEASNGDLWLHGEDEAFRITAAELAHALPTLAQPVATQRFDKFDGLLGLASPPQAAPNAVEATDGVLWFATDVGVARLDPKQLTAARTAPLHLRSLKADGNAIPLDGSVSVPALSRHLEITYDSTELGTPEHVRFRYRLDGFEKVWQEAGLRRTAYYNDLPPGSYRFQVLSTDAAGVWGASTGAVLEFRVQPAWFQTAWFRTACVVLVLLALWWLYRLRVARLLALARLQIDARRLERERIARDLHDSLLQSVYGLNLRLQAVVEKLKPGDPVREKLDDELVRSDEVLADGRRMLQDLREVMHDDESLGSWLNTAAGELAQLHLTRFRMTTIGKVRPLEPGVHEEVRHILEEAMTNAFQHARATLVELELRYGPSEFSARVVDNGIGLSQELQEKGRPEHFGLTGMRERAREIDAELRFDTGAAGGTAVELRLAARLAYRKARKSRFMGRPSATVDAS